ncbi:hypothetical protein [Nostoc sp. UHCC 0870]|uniref:hypothetical protein n=1 Tax=Nostoc sp. UHCC 0870 TaxID=2914041 RepID=UPI001EE0C4BB|nr:hypothetical protein [Nostoc sp. UHCC 0870]UKO99924.1 hypothetical protein L6494_09545 [Nostoc sp. UHCC 0870]
MSTLMMSDLLEDLSAEQQQILAGGQGRTEDDLDSGDTEENGVQGLMKLRSGTYRITKTSRTRAIVRIQKVGQN